MWKPITWFGWKSYFYNLYTVVIIILTYGFTLAEGIDLLFVSSSIDDFMNNIFSLLAMVNVCSKIAGILGKRKDIYRICQNFQTGCTMLFEIAGAGITIGRIYADRPENELPYRTVLPYDYSKPIIYRFTVVMQFIIICISGTILAGFDTLFPGIMLQICAKLNILKHRFKVIVTTLEEIRYEKQYDMTEYQQLETKLFNVWVKSHNDLLRLSADIESIFSTVILIQFSNFVIPILVCTIAAYESHLFDIQCIEDFMIHAYKFLSDNSCTALYNLSGAGITVGRVFAERAEYELPYRTPLPYDYNNPTIFRFTVAMQFIIIWVSANIQAAFDTFFVGIMLQICAKINILKHRFQVIVTNLEKIRYEKQYDVTEYKRLEAKFFNVWIKSHNDILRYFNPNNANEPI
ncbi:hypothetical protein PV327_005183 [Microctonus hyperodae]|uniref:Odorant receptor n=1 Tax=Microctonus hyperodae TaxID=165561 RepID=A0AA39G1L0_MICHY|nr:hypothetical protein PV327_005183 [Microctonus hyperodae]